ncbi:uncharacterized protein ColSpa_03871 [Colletotrichum spaethianum]|uniref:Uncharacterized protein n=1 Tax=Colletotrichum spaethianum TaxID=700344 RepID=A0AA37LCY9_9PEZI|nr:uncharacterized protein ColSpa_03871 [Colletotrichum spaethianum]GKT43690.1 hypothetical protein ColSpa_03871 [Colletotrichum spaethianum]
MTRKTRSSTICEWALGVSVEEYCNYVDRRRSRKSSGRQRISVEISTDDESEEDTVKITYPRANLSKNSNTQFSGIKKVRFDKLAPKSAMRTADSDANSEEKDKKKPAKVEDTSESESESKSKKKGDKSAKKNKKVVESSSESEETETETTETDTETDESEEEAPSPSKKKKKDVDASKKQEKTKDTKKPSKKSIDNTASGDVELNNVGPSNNGGREKDASKRKEKHKNVDETRKLRPEAALSPHLRRPNLIMPVRAEVLQVEHTIEGVEDPRPNAFHDPQHGVVRVYHGPAYGNPYGMLYPARNPNKAPLPVGVPHPLENPYFHGFANTTNPGDNHFRGQSPWGAVPVTCMPGGPPVMAPVDPTQTQMQMPSWWAPMSPTKAGWPKGSPKPVMSGAIQGDGGSTGAVNKDKGWDTNVGPRQNKTPSPLTKPASPNKVAPASPININLTVNPNTPWAAFAGDNGKKSTPDKNGQQTSGGGSNGSKKSWGSKKTTDWKPIASGQHPDLGWGTPTKSHGSTKGSNSAWAQTGGANNDHWGAGGGNGSNSGWNTSGNGQNNDAQATFGGDGWTTTNDTTWGGSNNNQAAAMHGDGWGASNDQSGDAWVNTGGKYNNWSTGSNHSGSKKSNRSQHGSSSNRGPSGQTQPATDWDGQGNNVGYSGHTASNGSNKSNKSKKNTPPPSTNGGWDNNAGPTTNSPVGDYSNKSNRSKHDAKKASNNGDEWATNSTSAWTTDNNAVPTNNNSPNNSHTSKNNSNSGGKGDDQWLTAGGGAGWGPETTSGDNWNPTATEMSKASSGSKSMPGAWDNTPPGLTRLWPSRLAVRRITGEAGVDAGAQPKLTKR